MGQYRMMNETIVNLLGFLSHEIDLPFSANVLPILENDLFTTEERIYLSFHKLAGWIVGTPVSKQGLEPFSINTKYEWVRVLCAYLNEDPSLAALFVCTDGQIMFREMISFEEQRKIRYFLRYHGRRHPVLDPDYRSKGGLEVPVLSCPSLITEKRSRPVKMMEKKRTAVYSEGRKKVRKRQKRRRDLGNK